MISPDNTWTLWAVIVTGTMVAIWLEQSYRWAAKLSAPVLALLIAMLLSNTGIMPTESPCYDFVDDYLVPLAIPLLLFKANLVRIARETGGMFLAFHISALGTMVGAALATLLLHRHIENPAGVAGIMTASYSGGSVNFMAVKESFAVREELTNPLLVADNFIMAGMFLLLLTIAGSKWFLHHFPAPHSQDPDESQANAAAEHWAPKKIGLLDIAKALALGLVIVAVAKQVSLLIEQQLGPSALASILGNQFVLITFLSMSVATLAHRLVDKIAGAEELGSFMLYVFLFKIGLPADLVNVLRNVPLLFLFCLIMAITNLIITLALGKLLRIDLEELLLCVNATLGGPPSAAAMAIAKGWSKLIVPSLLVGIWGYVIGTLLGVTVGELLIRLL